MYWRFLQDNSYQLIEKLFGNMFKGCETFENNT